MTIFARSSSGLRREFRSIDVFVFNVLAYAIGVSLVITPPLLGAYVEANLWLVFALGVLLSVSNGLSYGLLSAAMPRSGGDYVFITRVLHPWLGFVASFGFCASQMFGIGLYASQCISNALGSVLTVMGDTESAPWLAALGQALSKPVWNVSAAAVLLFSVYWVSVTGMRVLKYFLKGFFIIAILGVIAMGVVFWSIDHAEFVRRFDTFLMHSSSVPAAYDQVLKWGASNGVHPTSTWTFASSLLALPVGYLAFVGFTYSVYIGGEVRAPEKSQTRGIIGALLFGCVVLLLVLGRYYTIAGRDFIDALASLSGKNLVPMDGSLLLLASIMTDSVQLRILICCGFFLWYYLLLFVMAQTCVRILFAWSMDRLAPESWTNITPSTASPYMATRVVLTVAVIALVVSANLATAFLNYIALFSVCFLIAGIAAIVYPVRRKQEFARAPRLVRARFLGIPVLQIAGIGNTILFTVILVSSLARADVSGVTITGWKPYAVVVGVYGLGFMWYQVARRRPNAIDPKILGEQLPPDVDLDAYTPSASEADAKPPSPSGEQSTG
jgi:amino acid transporter